MLRLADFPHVVVITTPARWPAGYSMVARQLRAKGAVRLEGIVNGKDHLHDRLPEGVYAYGYAHKPPPPTFGAPAGAWYQLRTFKSIVETMRARRARSFVLVEDDVIITPEFDATLAAAEVPADWELIYFGGQNGRGSTEWADAEHTLLRCKSGVLANHMVAYRASIYDDLLALPETMPIDCGLSDVIQPRGRSYELWPPAAVQMQAMSTITGEMGGWPFLYADSGVAGE